MKREYTKPTIEGETFVANEYVAACWWIDYVNHPVKFDNAPNFDKNDADGDGCGYTVTQHGKHKQETNYYYNGINYGPFKPNYYRARGKDANASN